jgi:hypothetical protein
MMTKDIKKLLKNHERLIHSEHQKVVSHVQREQDDWFINTIMIEDISTAFKYKRKKLYQSLAGHRVNMTYYMEQELIAGMSFDVMNVVRIKVA